MTLSEIDSSPMTFHELFLAISRVSFHQCHCCAPSWKTKRGNKKQNERNKASGIDVLLSTGYYKSSSISALS